MGPPGTRALPCSRGSLCAWLPKWAMGGGGAALHGEAALGGGRGCIISLQQMAAMRGLFATLGRVLRRGLGRPELPGMPWQGATRMTTRRLHSSQVL